MSTTKKTALEAVEHLLGEYPTVGAYAPSNISTPAHKQRNVLTLPDRADNCKRVYWYLCSHRGIDPQIVSRLINEKKLYQQAQRGNCVFVGFDENNVPRYCTKRGTSPAKPFKGDHENSDKGYPFAMEGTSNRLFVTEGACDVMAHATLTKLHGVDYTKDHRIALGCLSDRALGWYLAQHPNIQRIVFALDNDVDGKAPDGSPFNHGQEATKKLVEKYTQLGYGVTVQVPKGKDFSEDLMHFRAREANLSPNIQPAAESDCSEQSL